MKGALQGIEAGLSGPERASSRSRFLPGLVYSPFGPVWSCVFWRWAVQLLGALTPTEEVQHRHEAGRVWRTRGHATIPGGHPGTGNFIRWLLKSKSEGIWNVVIPCNTSLSLHLKLSIPIEQFTSPPEDSLPLLRLYFRSLLTGTLKFSWCPILYVVALSHVNSFIFSQDAAAQVQ